MSAIWVPILAILMTFSSVVAIVMISLRYKARKLEHEEIMKALEKGQDLPTLEVHKKKDAQGDLKFGVILLAFGLGFYLFATNSAYAVREVAGIGFIFAFMGAGLIALYLISQKEQDKDENRPPTA